MNAFLSGGNLIHSTICKMFYYLTYDRCFEISCFNCTFKTSFQSVVLWSSLSLSKAQHDSLFPCYVWWVLVFLQVAEHLPAHGKQWINYLFCFACVCDFYFTWGTVFTSTYEVFFIFTLPIVSPTCTGEEWLYKA